jgi:hypothetical protein
MNFRKRPTEEELRRAYLYELMAGGAIMAGTTTELFRRSGTLSPLLTFTRTHVGGTFASNYDQNGGGNKSDYVANEPRFDGNGFLFVEGPRTNLILNSNAFATQNITVAAVPYQFTMVGGNVEVVFSGAHSDTVTTDSGNLIQIRSFTPSAGTLTCTVTDLSGGLDPAIWAQLEAGSFYSTWVPTAGATVTRSADLMSASLSTLGLPANGACTVFWVGYATNLGVAGNQTILQIDDGTNSNRYIVDLQSAGTNLRAYATVGGINSGSVSTIGIAGGSTPLYVGASFFPTGEIILCARESVTPTIAGSSGGPTSGLTTFRHGSHSTGGLNFFGQTSYLAVHSVPMNASRLSAAVAALSL